MVVDHTSEEDLKIVNKVIVETTAPEAIAELLKDMKELPSSIKEGNNAKATGIYDKLSATINNYFCGYDKRSGDDR